MKQVGEKMLFQIVCCFLFSKALAIQVSNRGAGRSNEFGENLEVIERQYYYLPQQTSVYYPQGGQYIPGVQYPAGTTGQNSLSPYGQYPQYQYQYPQYSNVNYGQYPGNGYQVPGFQQQQYPGNSLYPSTGNGQIQFPNQGFPSNNFNPSGVQFPSGINQGVVSQGGQQAFYRPQNGAFTTVPVFPTLAPIITASTSRPLQPGVTTRFPLVGPGTGFQRPGSQSIFPAQPVFASPSPQFSFSSSYSQG